MATGGAGYIQEQVDRQRSALQKLEADSAVDRKIEIEALKCLIDSSEKIITAVAEGKTLVWLTAGISPEIFVTMDIQSLNLLGFARTMTELRPEGATEFIDRAENLWLPPQTCSVLKMVIGGILAEQIPTPDLIIAGSHPCDSAIAGFEVIGELVKVPVFYLDIPSWKDDRTLDYVGSETKRMISFLEEHTGRKLDIGRLRDVAEESNKAEELYLEVKEIRKAVPCPQSGAFLRMAFAIRQRLAGLPMATAFFRELLADASEKVRSKKGAVPEERIRVIWADYDMPFGDWYNWLEREWGAVVPMSFSAYRPVAYIDTSSYDSMARGLGQNILHTGMTRLNRGPVEYYIDEFIRMYKDYKGDCAIFGGHVGNKAFWAMIRILKDVCREMGIPALVIEADQYDPRVVSTEAIRSKIDDFFTMMVLR